MSCPSSPKHEWCLRPSMFAPEASRPLRALLYCSRVNVSGFTYTAITLDLLCLMFLTPGWRHAGERTHVSQVTEPLQRSIEMTSRRGTASGQSQRLPVKLRGSSTPSTLRPPGMCESSQATVTGVGSTAHDISDAVVQPSSRRPRP